MINGIFSQLMIELNPRDQLGMTPFHYACKNGQLYMVSNFIDITEKRDIFGDFSNTMYHGKNPDFYW